VVEIDEFAVFLFYIFVTYRNKVDIIANYDDTPIWIFAVTTWMSDSN